ncbi:MAG TPA: AmmeMemoRadiSam system protein B [Spirochaetales bacterium]|nr:AmmeMemoRadiSam system protein B [Spirochaetales bacterium]HRY54704.1 AmmeMemoRadiSam system protein B [Spirochaetia bacterium]
MALRKRNLPRGWYPEDGAEVSKLLSGWELEGEVPAGAAAAVAPHAGWAFSGKLAYRALRSLRDAQTVAVIGGHLRASSQPLVAFEEFYDSPLGPLEADSELREELSRLLGLRKPGPLSLRGDEVPDNTVEVQLPLVKARFPSARVLWLRAPNGPASILLGQALSEAASSLGRKLACLGSTDLTHYGPSYGFAPAGGGPAAERWVREVNDTAFIEALLSMSPEEGLRRGCDDQSACSPGAAAAALAFALAEGATRAELLGYATSLELRSDESFVGYAALGFY